jgi:alpha-methylacyl-CoA racemase
MSSNPLLSGIRVLDLSRLLPGPFCSLYLAQLGAEVIKIEEPGGDPARKAAELFDQINRGKQSVVLDLKSVTDVHAFKKLVATADVVLESFRPGVMDTLGCGYDTLKTINPRLVYAAITGYGQTGPYRDLAGHDMNYLAIAGALDQIGARRGPPALANLQIADLAGGSLTCAIGILAALTGARTSGAGSFVDVSLTDGTAALQVVALATLRQYGQSFPRGEDMVSGALPNYSIYRCRDGKYLAVGALEPKFFKALVQGLSSAMPGWAHSLVEREAGRTGKTTTVAGVSADVNASANTRLQALQQHRGMPDPRSTRKRSMRLKVMLRLLLRTRTRDEWARLLTAHDACVTPVLTLNESLQNEQLRARAMILDDGGKPAFNLPIFFSNARAQHGRSPALGADNALVLSGLRGPGDGVKQNLGSGHDPDGRQSLR